MATGREKKITSDPIIGQPCWECEDCIGGYMPYSWRKMCQTCGCIRHCHQDFIHYIELLQKYTKEDIFPLPEKEALDGKYLWYPKGVEYNIVEKYMSSLPEDFKMSTQRQRMFYSQHPLQDTNILFCHNLPDIEKKRMMKFNERRQKHLGLGKVSLNDSEKVCSECSTKIKEGSIIVTADKVTTEKMWHPECFRCHRCAELLVDLIYFYSPEKDEIYCGRHHAETILSRCHGCDELIVSGTFTEAKEKNWHKHHFTCSKCDQVLHNKEYRYENNEVLICKSCFTKNFAEKCTKCKLPITLDQTKVTVKGNVMHKECFTCRKCKDSLSGAKYFKDEEGYLCERCQALNIVAQCHACKKGISASVSSLKHDTFTWHSECFKCILCSAWLADGKFHQIDGSIMCGQCFTQKNSRKCNKCQESILTRGIQLRLDWYHLDCFTCTECNKSLIDEKKVNSTQLLCHECTLKKGKKCVYCQNPITSRHTVYKGHSFHLECFKCNRCGASIQGNEFYETNLNEILCSKCGSLH